MHNLQPSPTEILEERLSDKTLRRAAANARLAKVLGALQLALVACREAAAAGNVRCQQGLREVSNALK